MCTIILLISHVIYIKDMKHALLLQNQDSEYRTIVDNNHLHLDHTVTGTLTTTAGYCDFPMEQYGPTAYIRFRRTSEEEL